MDPLKRLEQWLGGRGVAALLAGVLFVGLVYETSNNWAESRLLVRSATGLYQGHLPGPTEGGLLNPLRQAVKPKQQYRLMTIRHIPRIKVGEAMPHPYVGACKQCHLYQGGEGPGTQFKTPVGAVLERLSRVRKLGPPLHPDSEIPHPPAGRCIKCHDIVVKIPIKRKKGGFLWTM